MRPWFHLYNDRPALSEAANHYEIVIGDVEEVARRAKHHIIECRKQLMKPGAAYGFNWELYIPTELQQPFEPTHENMAALKLDSSLSPFELASNLRKAFSGIVAGNVKPFGIEQIKRHGPYLMQGEPRIMELLQGLLDSFV